ncbi:hypothetical protein [Mesorhizobium sp. B1-1-8]|uniref:hypothetical protein n=1 Tax=Mesorhizobium sp. B1-1-8 TaxID=2589976 RepID=UPI00112A0E7F|nr:hypothetical protein [Mesorhizobium sp. B1-1-8]UCI05677.1 hypothetical protein FJ974_17740 [Mesorhizobium sp. B1-1-8]
MSTILKMKFPGQWPQIEAVLQAGPTAADWDAAFSVCLSDRIQKRYLVPIRALQKGPLHGEGFTILTIQCALIEFLAALKKGWNFHSGAPWGVNDEYGSSRRLYKEFLTSEAPFTSVVTSDAEAETFYTDIRCALVHETQTKNGWRVRAIGPKAIDFSQTYVNRDLMQKLIDQWVQSYRGALPNDPQLQAAFNRKFTYINSHS